MNQEFSSLGQLRQLDMVAFLARLGFRPERISGANYWYKSPLREEHTPSFKVTKGDSGIDIFWDFGTGIHGNLVDFCLHFYGITPGALVEKLQQNAGSFFFGQPLLRKDTVGQKEKTGGLDNSKIKPEAIGQLQHPALLHYLQERAVPIQIAREYCKEIHYDSGGRKYFAIGFANDSGGYELRNPYFKGSISPKDSTLVGANRDTVFVTEGFMDFLSLQTIQQENPEKLPGLSQEPACLILNSLSLFDRAIEKVKSFQKVFLLLDSDQSGREATRKALSLSSQFSDLSHLYSGSKDLNEWLVNQWKAQLLKEKTTVKKLPQNKEKTFSKDEETPFQSKGRRL